MGGCTIAMHTIVFLKDVHSRLCHAEEKHTRLRLQAVCVHYFNCLFFFFFLIFGCTVYLMCAQLENVDLFSHLPAPEQENPAWRVGALDWSHTPTYFFCTKGVLHSFFYFFSPPAPPLTRENTLLSYRAHFKTVTSIDGRPPGFSARL